VSLKQKAHAPDLRVALPSDNQRMTSSHSSPIPFKAVIFDCDGTLVDSETSGMTALHEQACKLGYSLPLAQALDAFRGRRMALCIEMIEAHIGRPAPTDFMATVRRAMADKFRAGIAAMPGAPELLQALRRAETLYCIASNGPQDKMELTLGLAGLQGYFEKHVFSAYEVGHWKPSPELFFHAAREMGVEPSECAVVEDSLPGIAAGLAAGMRVYSMCEPKIVPADVAARVVQIEGLADLHAAFSLNSSL
jgi:HAD superfamily hydrolase (TIGR01509 family)